MVDKRTIKKERIWVLFQFGHLHARSYLPKKSVSKLFFYLSLIVISIRYFILSTYKVHKRIFFD